MYFNSRPRMRANTTYSGDAPAPDAFQLPPSHEGERRLQARSGPRCNFNSRPRMRANTGPPPSAQALDISTPALA